MKLTLIWIPLVDIQGREFYSGDSIWYAVNIGLHFDTHQQIFFQT